jgi:hypothetical protein
VRLSAAMIESIKLRGTPEEKPCVRKALRDEGQDRWVLREHALVSHERGDAPPLGIKRQVFWLALMVGEQIERHGLILGTGLRQGDVRCECAATRRIVELEHQDLRGLGLQKMGAACVL